VNTTLLFFIIGFTSSLVGFAAGYFAGDKAAEINER
jgi:hypothetical protein